ncbi:hypothetical protein NVP1265O_03 [Vibrio phage 1.265.O._10N.286.52.F6]|nr:hypothetical protein NVP1265O_03 [Vibrio phage 1.265.O._10N.286.52.F6]
MKKTYVKCVDWTWEDKLLYIKACIGEDIPHNKICGHATLSKDDLLSLYRFAHYIYCLDSGMIVYDGQTKNPDIGGKTEVKLSDLKPKPTKFVKVEESIFDLKGEFERGELYSSDCEGHYTQLKCEKKLYLAAHQYSVYRQVEIDWAESVIGLTPIGYGVYRSLSHRLGISGSYDKEQALILANAIIESLTEKPTN